MKTKIFFLFLIFSLSLTNNASIGSVTIDGKIYNQISMRPEFEFRKLKIGLDLYFYIDDEGGFYDKSWDFSNGKAFETVLDKIYYLKFNEPSDRFYFRLGSIPSATLGYGIIVNSYSNTVEYPNVRRIGLDMRFNSPSGINTQILVSDLKRTPGMMAFRTSFPIASRLNFGVFAATDIDMSKGLTDSDDDNYPDYFDDFPNDENFYNEAEQIAQNNGWNDADGLCTNLISSGTYSSFDNCYADILSENHNSYDPNEINKQNISAIGFDMSLKMTRKVTLYSQFAQMLGEELEIENLNNNSTYKGTLGWGAIPIGMKFTFGPTRFKVSTSLDYRYNERHFMYNFWDQTYELNRAQVVSDSEITTKRDLLLSFGKQSGLFFGLDFDVLNLISLNLSYQNMKGETWDDNSVADESFIEDGYFQDEQQNKSFLAKLNFNTSRIPKLKIAELYYQRNNDSDPFDFDNPSTNTVHGYNLGYQLSDGVVLVYKGRTTYVVDLSDPGKVEPNFSLQFETQIEL